MVRIFNLLLLFKFQILYLWERSFSNHLFLCCAFIRVLVLRLENNWKILINERIIKSYCKLFLYVGINSTNKIKDFFVGNFDIKFYFLYWIQNYTGFLFFLVLVLVYCVFFMNVYIFICLFNNIVHNIFIICLTFSTLNTSKCWLVLGKVWMYWSEYFSKNHLLFVPLGF